MATILDEDEELLNSKSRSGPTFVGSGYAGGGDQGGGAPAPEKTSNAPKTSGSGFVNIENYLRGPNQGRMSAALSGETDKAGNEAISSIANYDNEVAAKTSGGPAFDPGVGGEWLYNASVSGNSPEKPAAFDWGNVTAKQTAYGGPEGYSDSSKLSMYSPMLAATAKAKERVDLSKKEEGVQTQLQDLYGKGTPYTQGENLLDTQIARTGEGKNLLQQSQNKWGQVDSWLKGSEAKAQGQIEGAKNNVTNVNEQWANAGKLAEQKAIETNKYFGDSNKRIADEKDRLAKEETVAKEKAARDAARKIAERDKAMMDPIINERKAYLGSLVPGGLREGWVWSQQDIDNYMTTGKKPDRPKATSSGTYSTPEGYF